MGGWFRRNIHCLQSDVNQEVGPRGKRSPRKCISFPSICVFVDFLPYFPRLTGTSGSRRPQLGGATLPLLCHCCTTVQLCSSATVPHQLVKSGNLTTHHLVKWSSLESQDKDPLIGEHHHAGRLKTAWMEILVQKPQSCRCISASSPSATFEHQTGHHRYAEGSGAKAMSGERGYIDVLCSFLSQPLARFECRWRP